MSSNSYSKNLNNHQKKRAGLAELTRNAKQLIAVLLLSGLMIIPSYAASWHEELPNATLVGSGHFRWLGFKIYSAKLWSESKHFDANAKFALELTYNRSISSKQFIKTTIDEIKRLNGHQISAEKLALWQKKLVPASPDVTSGDALIGVYLPAQGYRVYNKHGLLADIQDPELARAFFAIWLDPRTKDSGLRAQLLGTKK